MTRSHQASNSGSAFWHSGWERTYSTVRLTPSSKRTVAKKPGTSRLILELSKITEFALSPKSVPKSSGRSADSRSDEICCKIGSTPSARPIAANAAFHVSVSSLVIWTASPIA